MPEYQSAKSIGIYLSMPTSELSTQAIIESSLQHGKKVFVPYIQESHSLVGHGRLSVMNMVSLHSKSDYDSLEAGKWGIPAPDTTTVSHRESCLENNIKTEQSPEGKSRHCELDVIIVPGVAFDTSRRRLGHGKGFYDTFLSQYDAQRRYAMPCLGKLIWHSFMFW